MAAPPSREAWVWQIAQQALDHCCALGSRLDDLETRIIQLEGVALVSVSDWSLKKRGVPLLIASGAIAGADTSIGEEVRQAIEVENRRRARWP